MRTVATSARAKYMQYLESERSKEKTETKQLKRKALEETVNSAQYVEALRNQFIPAIQSEPDFESMWFMQDGATPHHTNEVFDLLEEHFDERIVALGYPKLKNMGIDWPPYSPDLNPCDSFL
ncbi:hypothetical protein AVEN_204265-1 [Araneus ventricosus]|uniref:Tc1-like transposase DDE domain-containing protein n=1 Tax=Araneus ventricosus TaxID=182803 RepID=A0A4Y2T5H2_ARAVE|nr:hypothetical protein AVEN_204265-1 [Araneus ventricosus]